MAVRLCSVLGLVALIAASALGLLLARLSQGPLALDFLTPRVINALEQRFGHAYQFDLQRASLSRNLDGFSLALEGLSVMDSAGRPVLATPTAHLSVDPLALLGGGLVPRHLEIRNSDLNLSILPDGQLAISAGGQAGAAIAISGAIPALTGETDRSATMPLAPQVTDNSAVPAAAAQSDTDRTIEAIRAFTDLALQSESPLGALDRLGITHTRLSVADSLTGRTIVFDGVDLEIEKDDAAARISLKVDGPNGRWTSKLRAARLADGQRSLTMDLRDLSFDDIALLAGLRKPGFVLDTPISAHVEWLFDAGNKLASGHGRLALGAGLVRKEDKDSEPVLIDEITGDVKYDPVGLSFVASNWHVDAGTSHFEFGGALTPPAAGKNDWKFNLASVPGSQFGEERPGEKPIAFDTIVLAGSILPQNSHVTIDKLELAGPEISGDFSIDAEGGDNPRFSLAGTAQNTSLPAAIRLWPSFIAPPVRTWFLQHVMAGRIDKATIALDFDAAALDQLDHDHPAPDEAMQLDVSVSGAAFSALPGLPPVAGLALAGSLSGRRVNVSVRQGYMESSPGHRLDLSDTTFVIADTGLKPAPAAVSARLTGSIDTAIALLSTESLKPYANLPLDPASVKGTIDGRMLLDMKLGKPSTPEDTQVRVAANLTNFSAEKLIGKERLEAGTLTLNFDRNGFKSSGQGRMFGQPATIELRKVGNDAGSATIGVTLDDAARTRLGWANGALSGPVSAKIVAPLGLVDEMQAQVDVDFGKANLDGLLPGLVKPAGKAAKASFSISGDKNGSTIEDLTFEAAAASLRGSAELAADGSLKTAKLTQARLSGGDDMRAELSRTADALKLTVRGNTLDARPFLAMLLNPPAESGRERAAADLDVDMKLGQITGQNRQVLSAAEAKFSRRGGIVRQLQLSGRFGNAAVTGTLAGQGQINVHSDNAGAFLAFVDFYRRMEGGDLTLALRSAGGRTDGQVLIHDFLLRDEPALRRLVTEGANVREDSGTKRVQETRFDPGLVEFQKLQVSFVKSGGRIELRDGIMYGPQIGTSLEGAVDFAKNYIDVKGTFVPAYGLNNFFARIPVIGLLLGGSSHEGLFAVNFRVAGPASGPTLNINPLSALAPGFLRKIFGAGDIPAGFQTRGAGQQPTETR